MPDTTIKILSLKVCDSIAVGMSDRNGVRVTIQIPEQLLDDVDDLADEQGRYRSELMRDALRRYLDVNQGEFGKLTESEQNLSVTVDRLIDEVHWLGQSLDEIQDELE